MWNDWWNDWNEFGVWANAHPVLLGVFVTSIFFIFIHAMALANLRARIEVLERKLIGKV